MIITIRPLNHARTERQCERKEVSISMDLSAIEVIVEIAKTGSISKAAKICLFPNLVCPKSSKNSRKKPVFKFLSE